MGIMDRLTEEPMTNTGNEGRKEAGSDSLTRRQSRAPVTASKDSSSHKCIVFRGITMIFDPCWNSGSSL